MRFITMTLALLASSLLVAAAPAEGEKVKRDCPDNWNCGECNGTSCKIGISNFACTNGKCTAQSGGGDGAACHQDAEDNRVYCPGN
ncbi:hypothetical protein ASPZODRAFT_134424 [Penicilliopsis zonata CBS 506.65]|uniref:Uncharacterized protein n=1 Tax=Penicilliopsis zonata CBS 506.65 TaxID=1073090 RepID=A0A1L9SCY5_9EURO|nr:hypothetical protein ASPZODRAFT_134424 [Penicilliopsis zonata CBS 506.65]OJJ44998.1 hypothetical protein ASPZODRAFT_134424 [Penicilliopsis zonata CBS 506.65]